MRNITVLSGTSHPQLTQEICGRLGVPQGRTTLAKFANRETHVAVGESVRDVDVYIVQSACGAVNDNFVELLIMISACRTASARKITAVIPCFPYARQPETPYSQSGQLLPRVPPSEATKFSALAAASSRPKLQPQEQPPAPMPLPLPSPSPLPTHVAVATSAATPIAASAQSPLPPSDPPASLNPRMSAIIEEEAAAAAAAANSLSHVRRRFSSISTSQPNIEVTSLAPQTPSTDLFKFQETTTKQSVYKHWTARSGTLIANMLMAAGADHIITMDLHDPQYQGFFDIPVDNLHIQPLILKYIKEKIPNYRDAVVVSPDAGGAKRATVIADKLGMDFALIHRERRPQEAPDASISDMILVGDVRDKVCMLIDDIADTSYTITRAAQILVDNGATKIIALITHGILSGNAIDRINASAIDELIVSDTVPQDQHISKSSKIRVIPVAPMIAEAIRRIHNGESVSFLFDVVPY